MNSPDNRVPDGSARNWKRWLVEALAFFALWMIYFAYGIWLRNQIPLDAAPGELHGFDYNAHGILFSDHHLILFTRFRHPLFGWLMSPIPLFGERLARLSFETYWGYLSLIFSGFVTVSVWLVYRIAARIKDVGRWRAVLCAAGFACFGYMRYLAAGPESFPVSMAIALAVLWWGCHSPFDNERRQTFDRIGWGVLLFLSGGITITQGVKTALSYLVARRPTRRTGLFLGAGALLLAIGGTLFYVVKLVWLGSEGGRTIGAAIEELLGSIPHGLSWGQRMRMIEMFLCEPIIPHGVPYSVSKITAGYDSWWPYALCAVLYLLAAVGAWRLRHTRILRLMAATLSIDIVIHFVFFWGMDEAQIYCGHWFYALPILVAGAIAKPPCPQGMTVASHINLTQRRRERREKNEENDFHI